MWHVAVVMMMGMAITRPFYRPILPRIFAHPRNCSLSIYYFYKARMRCQKAQHKRFTFERHQSHQSTRGLLFFFFVLSKKKRHQSHQQVLHPYIPLLSKAYFFFFFLSYNATTITVPNPLTKKWRHLWFPHNYSSNCLEVLVCGCNRFCPPTSFCGH